MTETSLKMYEMHHMFFHTKSSKFGMYIILKNTSQFRLTTFQLLINHLCPTATIFESTGLVLFEYHLYN